MLTNFKHLKEINKCFCFTKKNGKEKMNLGGTRYNEFLFMEESLALIVCFSLR